MPRNKLLHNNYVKTPGALHTIEEARSLYLIGVKQSIIIMLSRDMATTIDDNTILCCCDRTNRNYCTNTIYYYLILSSNFHKQFILNRVKCIIQLV